MKNWDTFDEIGQCNGEKEFADAEWICSKLNVPLLQVNFVKEYWNDVFGYHNFELHRKDMRKFNNSLFNCI